MSLQKVMHPRNIYKENPDFKQLALLYPEFRKVATTDLGGKVHIDFKNEETLRILTKILLKHDFNLTVKIPPNKLVPTIPLRLNYVLWIEDLMAYAFFTEMKNIKGIDIGTGAVCIYPLLLAKMYGYSMFGTEINETSIESAIENVKNNTLENLIKVIKVDKENIFKEVINENEHFHFTMCNPPFFETQGNLDKVIKQRPPRNAPTGSNEELSVEGGETLFVTRMIEESIQIGEKIKIYTTMLGKRKNSLYFPKFLRKHGIKNFTWTEFCQGYTKRWGIAWSFLSMDICNLRKAPVVRESNIPNIFTKRNSLEIQFPMGDKYVLIDDIVAKLKKIIADLQMNIIELEKDQVKRKESTKWVCQLTARNDTWSHARRKRRLAERLNKDCKKIKLESTVVTEQTNTESEVGTIQPSDVKDEDMQLVFKKDTEISDHKDLYLVFVLFLNLLKDKKYPEENNVNICLFFESGTGGKHALERFRQYLVNKLNVRVHFEQFCSSKWNKNRNKRYKKAKKKSSCELNNAHGEEEKEKKVDILPAENGASENGATENGATENDAVENGATENDAVENGATENDAVENGAPEDSAANLS
ncbi:PREDICTED: methyltransferase-like protein 16 isoform X1 [Polistes canadensis]|uniref:methyltransferase-like protein 16 isoform X1 n=2 Tax=Polistes canadensis TaxID=91411 RepID=UPI000718BE54|nr:PREDICTED: methyltransferase-like protein 16 isoform X1 [Polistes canadensis]